MFNEFTDVSAVADEAENLLREVLQHYDETLPEISPIDPSKIDSDELEKIKHKALLAESITDKNFEVFG